jgi:hypothetical protein
VPVGDLIFAACPGVRHGKMVFGLTGVLARRS